MLRLRGHTETGSNSGPGTILKFRKGEIVYAQGDPATDWFEVMSGTVRTCFLYSDGHRQLTGFFYPGDVFGIDSGHYTSSAEAVTAVTLRRCGRGFGEDSQPNEAPPVHGALRSALDNAQACIFLLGRRTAAERMAAFLLATAKRFPPGKPFALPMSRSDIADHLGLTIHTVSRTLSEFVRRNLISLDGPQSITIEDYPALKNLSDGDDNLDLPLGTMPSHANVNSSDFTPRFGS
jgi:CRP/FNR family transcriptional regulator/CRP/FNR family nitrogen fixation transcriptional regulator